MYDSHDGHFIKGVGAVNISTGKTPWERAGLFFAKIGISKTRLTYEKYWKIKGLIRRCV